MPKTILTLDDLRGNEESCALAPEMTMAVGHEDETIQEPVEITDVNVLLGDIEEGEIIDEQPSEE